VFRQANEVIIRSGRDMLTSTAIIKLSNVKTFIGSPNELDRAFSVGDEVSIELGYDGANNLEFVGYVAEKRPNVPYEIHCEDSMWKLKQKRISGNYPSIKLSSLIKALVPESNVDNILDVTLTNFRINNATVSQVLNQIKTTYGLDIYFRGKTLYCGLAYMEGGKTIKYHLQDNTIKNSLVFQQPGDFKIRVRAISLNSDNTSIETELGDADGNFTTLHFSNLSLDALKTAAGEKVKELKIRGYKGSVVAWGRPFAQHGDVAKFIDRFYPERQQSNFIDQVTVEWGAKGFRRTIVPGRRAS